MESIMFLFWGVGAKEGLLMMSQQKCLLQSMTLVTPALSTFSYKEGLEESNPNSNFSYQEGL
jgi:hypothetical protein